MDFLSYREQLGIGLCDNKKYQHFLTILFNFLNGIPTDRSFSGISTKEYLRLLQYNWNANKQYVYE